MKIMIITDAWAPQVNGVVRTLTKTRDQLQTMGHDVMMVTPKGTISVPCPTYPEIRLSLFPRRKILNAIKAFAPDALHIATEGPLGLAARRIAIQNHYRFTTAYHTRFPEYVRSRIRLPLTLTYRFLRWFHAPSQATLAPTKTVVDDLKAWRVGRPVLWPRGVDLDLFRPIDDGVTTPAFSAQLGHSPIFLYVGRVSIEKNLEAFLSLDLPGEKHVVGGGPALAAMQTRYPNAVFHGAKAMTDLPAYYHKASVFVFPSKTDTFGLVLLEAMACGVPVAAFPVTGPIDVVGDSGAGVLDTDLKKACLAALSIDRKHVRAYAKTFSWHAATTIFAQHLTPMHVKNRGLKGANQSFIASNQR